MSRASTVLITLLVAGTAAHAQKPSDKAAAQAALDEGRRLYDLQEWDQAIAKFKESYKLRPEAPALFNIAQAYRLKGDCTQAASFYRTYKRNFPREKNIAKTEKFITEMDACAKAAATKPPPSEGTAKSPTDPATPPTDASRPTTTEPQPSTTKAGAREDQLAKATLPPHADAPGVQVTPSQELVTLEPDAAPAPEGRSGSPLRIAGLVTAGLGVIALGGGAYYGLEARSATDDANHLPLGATWNPEIQDRGQRAERNAKILLIGGGAAVVAGTIMILVGRTRPREHGALAVIPERDGASAVWSCAF